MNRIAKGYTDEEIAEMPHFGDDLYRAVAVLPGTSAKDFSARFSVRGGMHEDVLVRLDGLELVEPFHLKDLDGVFNVVDPEIIGGVDLTPDEEEEPEAAKGPQAGQGQHQGQKKKKPAPRKKPPSKPEPTSVLGAKLAEALKRD